MGVVAPNGFTKGSDGVATKSALNLSLTQNQYRVVWVKLIPFVSFIDILLWNVDYQFYIFFPNQRGFVYLVLTALTRVRWYFLSEIVVINLLFRYFEISLPLICFFKNIHIKIPFSINGFQNHPSSLCFLSLYWSNKEPKYPPESN